MNYLQTIELYKKYLQTPREDWQKEIRRPIKSAIFKAMCATQAKIGDNPEQLIVNSLEKGGNLYFWSDLHLFHTNIIKYANRPFIDVSHMNKAIISNYYKIVKENDVVVFCGDISFGKVELTTNLLRGLPGKKILVLGNHDFEKNNCQYRDYKVFDIVTMCFQIKKKMFNKDYFVIVSHYPISEDFLPESSINIHGHIHQYCAGDKNINVSVEHTNFSPKNIEDLIKKIVF